jgi:protein TonB
MKSRSLLAASWDIKRPYQRNLAIGFGISGLVHLAIVSTVVVFFSSKPELEHIIIDKLPPPPPISSIRVDTGPIRDNFGGSVKPKAGIIIPVSDVQAPVENNIPDQKELSEYYHLEPINDFSGGEININAEKVAEELLPSPDKFIPCDEMPVAISTTQPIYPDLARRAGLEAKVWLKALIDKDGNVRDVKIIECSNKDIGFEEAAITAAWKSSWKPAIANGLPVAVWITYAVVFTLQ